MENLIENPRLTGKIYRLAAMIQHHNERYYNQDTSEISDYEYDKLVAKLKTLDPNHPVLSYLGRSMFGNKIKHRYPMGSLLKAHTAEEILELNEKTIAMPKIDGVSLSVVYMYGKLTLAITRGDGIEGEDVTENAKQIVNLPKTITTVLERVEVRGEVYVNRDWFFTNMSATFANPRNYAAGSLKQRDPNITKARNLSFIAYRAINLFGMSLIHKDNELIWLNNHNFETPQFKSVIEDIERINEVIDYFAIARKNLHYDCDGIVFWISDSDKFNKRGVVGLTPKGALAYKFNTDKVQTQVKDIEWNTTRTGRIVPVMIVDPVQLSGTIVQRVTLNNYDFLTKNDVAIGDLVEIEKANEIIPKLVSVIQRVPALRVIAFPDRCPSCRELTSLLGVDVICNNPNCNAQIVKKLLHFIRAANIEGFSSASIQQLVCSRIFEQKILFEITESDLRTIGFGPKVTTNFLKQLKNIKLTPAEFLASLGISGIGQRVWEKALEIIPFDTFVDNLLAGKVVILQNQVGLATADKIIKGIAANADFITEVLPYIHIVTTSFSLTLAGKIFCITGTLSKPRPYYVQEIINRGGKVTGISAKTDYLVCGNDPGSKLQKATQYKLKTINESELKLLLK